VDIEIFDLGAEIEAEETLTKERSFEESISGESGMSATSTVTREQEDISEIQLICAAFSYCVFSVQYISYTSSVTFNALARCMNDDVILEQKRISGFVEDVENQHLQIQTTSTPLNPSKNKRCGLEFQNLDCCTEAEPCGQAEGGCSSDADCAGDLVCHFTIAGKCPHLGFRPDFNACYP